MNGKIVSVLALSAIGIYILSPLSPLRVDAQAPSVAQATSSSVASDGADHVGAGAVARSGAEHATGQVASDGSDHVGAGAVASDGSDHVGANAVASDGAERVHVNGLAADRSDRVGRNQVASNATRMKVGGIGSDAVASLSN